MRYNEMPAPHPAEKRSRSRPGGSEVKMADIAKRKRIRQYFEMTVGVIMMVIGIYFFKIPYGFTTGGVSGVATVLGRVFAGGRLSFLTPGVIIIVLNILLIIIGYIFLGRSFGMRTVYCSLMYSGLVWILEQLIPLDRPLTDQPLMELIYGIMLSGIGSGLIFHAEGSSGGTDILALILKKYTSLNVGKALLCFDTLIAATSFYVFGLEIGLFSMMGLFLKAFLVDSVIENMNICKSFTIVTTHPEEIVRFIIDEMKHSATEAEAHGAYTGEAKTLIFTSCRRIEAVRLKKKIYEIDPNAFVTVQSTSEIIGRGFRAV